MKKIIVIVVVSLLAIVGAIYLDFTIDPKNHENEIRTYDSGYEEGRLIGKEIGYENGYDEGYDEGYYVGYDDGHSDGYYDGATYTCLFFGDVDRAFQTALNGSAWFTFIDAYDQYISNIYDDNTTRSELFWAIVSATLSEDGATKEEKELLISTFGKDLFTRNGITLD